MFEINYNHKNINEYDYQLSSSAIKNKFINEINKLGPFGNYNFLPTFLINNLKVIKHDIIKNKQISVILK